jgi:hypothetical protein
MKTKKVDCEHHDRAKEFTLITGFPTKQRWVCRDCGYIGENKVSCLTGDFDFMTTVAKFEKKREEDNEF